MLVGLGKPDDAAVWRIDDHQALVVTVDFFTPVVDTPYEYGAIAASNALSDLYAMGAKPIFALNVAAMPATLPAAVVREIMRGGAEKVREAGAVIAGGHTVQDDEPKYGLVAIGLAQQERLITKNAVQLGDKLVLTKPLGSGVTTTALKNGKCSPEDEEQVIAWMSQLNSQAARIATDVGVVSGTDITGFGYLGHALELANASHVGFDFWLPAIPFLRGALDYAREGQFPGGSADNTRYFRDQVSFDSAIDDYSQMLLFDAQTSGGLLLAVSPSKLERFLELAAAAGQPAWVVGQAVDREGIYVHHHLPESPQSTREQNEGLIFIS